METNYAGYRIVVTEIYSNIGRGFRAVFAVPQKDGADKHTRIFETYNEGDTLESVVNDVCLIIDTIGKWNETL